MSKGMGNLGVSGEIHTLMLLFFFISNNQKGPRNQNENRNSSSICNRARKQQQQKSAEQQQQQHAGVKCRQTLRRYTPHDHRGRSRCRQIAIEWQVVAVLVPVYRFYQHPIWNAIQ